MTAELPTTAPLENDDQIDLRELIGILIASWPVIAGFVGAAAFLALTYLYIAPPRYTTDALVQVESNANPARVAFAQVAEAFTTEIPVTAEVEILKSRLVIGAVVDRLGLDVVAEPRSLPLLGPAIARRQRSARFGEPPFWLKPFDRSAYAWGGEAITVSTFQVPPQALNRPFYLRLLDTDGQYQILDEEQRPLGEGRVGVLATLPLSDDTDPIELFVQELRGEPGTEYTVMRMRRDAAIRAVQDALTVTASRTALGMVNLSYTAESPQQAQRVLTEILNAYQKQNVERRSAEAEQTLSFLKAQLPELKAKLETAEARLNQFKVEQGTADLTQETSLVLSRSVELERNKAELLQQRNEALQRFTVNHPVVQALDAQIAQIDAQLRQVNARIRQLPDIEQHTLQLMRDVQVATALYVALLNRTQELEVVRSGTIGSIRIIDTPFLPSFPSQPKRLLVGTLSLILGGLLGVIAVFVLNALRTGVEDPAIVEKKLGLPTYGAIPYSEEQARLARALKRGKSQPDGLLVLREPNGVAVEALRSLRTALHFAQMDAPNNRIMLTGPEPDLGKSFVSINLGAVLAQAKRRVVVVDADLRRGHINKLIAAPRAPGLSELISGAATLEQILCPTPVEGLMLIPTGTYPPNPAELLINERFVELLQGLSERFDHVLIDTPPVLAVTDAAIIGRHAGITLVVLKAGEHPLRMIEETVNRLTRAGVAVRGTLFNQIGRTRQGRYGYKYGYYYGGYRYDYRKRPSGS
ncbi:tyrosine-protein kinase Etk/Wzc [Fontimonas thermophila]|uniref:Tyrosine-protein kinase Etk/Wzc n=1 Tax=Fontimonas thermophila TaxID=1076937 RepID=A0A1I2IM77_9GAMM|nr:polysaccharide biosynthesis tyrosine autokinase [Fontimonas thermophila]SFF42718.1 tyrosine-protein kinase Etk/Wzc [Fontimonas thermophila]